MKIENEKILLLHPGKTGGTSIEHTLRDLYLPEDYELRSKTADRKVLFGFDKQYRAYLQHADLRLLKIMGISIEDYKTICTVRRPYERLVSCYYYNGAATRHDFETFVTDVLPKKVNHACDAEYSVSHFCPQHFYGDGVDHIIQLENFEEDCAKVDLKVSYHYSKTEGATKHEDRMSLYTPKLKEIVYALYREDFKLFGYKK